MRKIISFLLVLALFAAACGDDSTSVTGEEPGGNSTRPSVAGDWILRSLTFDGDPIALPTGEIEMNITAGEITGTLGCNSFFGTIDAADDGAVVMGPIGQTEMACVEEGRMEFESTYGRALTSVTRWAVDPTGLALSSATAEIRYEPAPDPVHQPLQGTVWNFDTVYDGEGANRAATHRADMDGVTLVIEGTSVTVSHEGCVGTSSVQFEGVREGPITRAAGDPVYDEDGGCDVVALALDGILLSSGFMIDENRLTFIGVAGETVGFFAVP